MWPSALSPIPNIKPSYTGCSCLLKTLNIKDRRDTPSAITHHATRTLCKTTWMERKISSEVHNSPWLHSIFSPTPFVFDFLFLHLNYRIDVNIISLKQRRLLMRNSVWSVKTLQSHSKMTHVVSRVSEIDCVLRFLKAAGSQCRIAAIELWLSLFCSFFLFLGLDLTQWRVWRTCIALTTGSRCCGNLGIIWQTSHPSALPSASVTP